MSYPNPELEAMVTALLNVTRRQAVEPIERELREAQQREYAYRRMLDERERPATPSPKEDDQ